MRKRLWWLGWCKARLRDGLCDYCYLWRTRESRQINGFLDGLQERLEALGDHCFTEWLEATKTHALFSKPGFERAASPKYLNALATFLESHCLPTSQDLVKRFFFSRQPHKITHKAKTKQSTHKKLARFFEKFASRISDAANFQYHLKVKETQDSYFSWRWCRTNLRNGHTCFACDYGCGP